MIGRPSKTCDGLRGVASEELVGNDKTAKLTLREIELVLLSFRFASRCLMLAREELRPRVYDADDGE